MNNPSSTLPTKRTPSVGQSGASASARPRKAHPIRWTILVLLGLGLIYVLFVRPFTTVRAVPGNWRNSGRPVPVGVDTARSVDLPVRLAALGSITPLNVVTVRSRVDGQLVKVYFQEGQNVEEGALLAEIDPRPYQVQKLQAEAQLAKDRALMENAQVDLNRFKALLAQDSVAKQQVDTQEALVRQYEAGLKVDQAQVENTNLQLSYTKITAPIAGRTGLRLVDAGNMVHASDAGGLTVITQLQPIGVLFSIPQESLGNVLKHFQAGDSMEVTALDRDGKTVLGQGKLITVDNQLDPATGTVKLRGEFPNTDHSLFANQFVNIQLQVEVMQGAVVVPIAALQRGSVGTFLYVVDGESTVHVRTVETGPQDGETLSITKGLEAGETVVVDGVDKLRDGGKVETVARGGKQTPVTAPAGAGPDRSKWGGDRSKWQNDPNRPKGDPSKWRQKRDGNGGGSN